MSAREEIFNAMDDLRMSMRRVLLDAFEAGIRKDIAAYVRSQAPKRPDNEVDQHVFWVLDSLAKKIETPRAE